MAQSEELLSRWEEERVPFLFDVLDSLGLPLSDLESGPLVYVAAVEEFLAAQDYAQMDDDDWVWLHTFLAAFIAQVFMVEHSARWVSVQTGGRTAFHLTLIDREGAERSFDPHELVYNDFQKRLPPEVVRMLAAAEAATGVVPVPEP
ncbi:hypothetical protein [Nocardia camponoti]|uniref:DUF3806 domain-containing protein n=1 Tax=Nocardia camponoti TaxID=1616106 RepID=A0A917QJW2_9NOCA|nr:hypothetical protein [Nocardia camponoti]GGK54200.1 hypothetical protein GCM10011591_27450 [Nocardia camponoti]